jgi:hypothetical protein
MKRTKEQLMADIELPRVVDSKLMSLRSACEEAICSGFKSSALGQEHTYGSDRDDQLNLLGLAGLVADTPIKCFDGVVWSYKLHTPEQVNVLLDDGRAHKYTHLLSFHGKRSQIYGILEADLPSEDKVTNINSL